MKNHSSLMQKLGYTFQRTSLLKMALTHRSVSENTNNERLEFLGDAILSFIVGEQLFQRCQKMTEGELSRLRARLVCKETLVEIARALDVGDFIALGVGEVRSGGSRRDSTLADALEAIIAAIYLDGGLERCRSCVLQWYGNRLDRLLAVQNMDVHKDAKSRLQEYLQSKKIPLPVYEITQIEGKSHDQTFYLTCRIVGIEKSTQGVGHNRRAAEQAAAEAFLELLKAEHKK